MPCVGNSLVSYRHGFLNQTTIGLTDKKKTCSLAKDVTTIHCIGASVSPAGLTSWTYECCDFSHVALALDVSPNLRLFLASGNLPGSLASLLTRTESSDIKTDFVNFTKSVLIQYEPIETLQYIRQM